MAGTLDGLNERFGRGKVGVCGSRREGEFANVEGTGGKRTSRFTTRGGELRGWRSGSGLNRDGGL